MGSERLAEAEISADEYAQNILDYIRNNIEVEYRYGLGKGARGAIIDQSGTPFDQAELMVKLLEEGGVSASYQLGSATMTADQFGRWTGVVHNLDINADTFQVSSRAACELLSSGGIPNEFGGNASCDQLSGTVSDVTFGHIWVTANGKSYDPSFKQYSLSDGQDPGDWLGCALADCVSTGLSLLTSEATTADHLPGIPKITGYAHAFNLDEMATDVQSAIHTYFRSAAVVDVVGGKELDTAVLSTTGGLPYSASPDGTGWSGDIPDAYRDCAAGQLDRRSALRRGPRQDTDLVCGRVGGSPARIYRR